MSPLTQYLSEHHYPLQLVDGQLTGPGAEFLQAQAHASRFMLLGEEHGVGSNLEFALALFNAIQPLGYTHYVTEIGPISATQFNRMAREAETLAAFQAFYTQYPFSVPFAWLEEEVHLHQAVCASAPHDAQPIIGIDQEFIFSPQWHLDTLRAACTDQAWQNTLGSWVDLERQANHALANGTPPDQLTSFMNRPLPEGWTTLRDFFTAQNNSDALAIMDALQASHQIYMHYAHKEYYDNNHVRGLLMRKYFYTAYQNALATQPDARFLIKLGANHVSRGHTSMGILDIGTFIAELAAMQNAHSFHLLVLPTSGALNAWLPFLPPEFKAHPVEGDYGPEFAPLLEATPVKTGWNLYDLRLLRHRQNFWSKDRPAFKDLFLRYDAVLLMDNVRPATLLNP
ncbi:MAG: hypothetical protein HUU38_20490 [Anaerolineales bacterium]|nr:hypothetical protein [Anaerolineales bacterium]